MVMRVISIFFIMVVSFVLGVTFSFNQKPNSIERAKLTVSAVMYYPTAASFKDVALYAPKKNGYFRETGNVCGWVLAFKDDLPYKHKQFIVQVAKDGKGEEVLSIALIDFEGETISEDTFQKIWNERCVELIERDLETFE